MTSSDGTIRFLFFFQSPIFIFTTSDESTGMSVIFTAILTTEEIITKHSVELIHGC